ncbi:spermine oxidase-like, partial [Lingula anatina]|uniref:Spermine oxidase-like n=1 Tax=Lingula anatina TaxID=7574 RepID=A0A1S3JCG1_LINAN
ARGYFYRSNGRQIDKELGAKVWALFKEIEAEVETGHPWPNEGDKTLFTMRDYYVVRLQENLKKFPAAERTDIIAIFNCCSNYLRFHWGVEIANIPLELCSMAPEIEGGDVLIPRGTRSLVNAIISRFRCEERLNIEKQATSISWGDDLVEIRCSSGDIYRAKCVVVTVSLGYLKEHHRNLFQPSLPHEKIEAIHGLDFGLVDKIFLHYDRPFWSSEVGFGSVKLAWDDDEAVITDPKSQWYKRIFSFDDVYFNPSCLCVWISCNEAYHMEHLSEEDISETCTGLLRQFLGDPSIPKPSKVIWSTWGTNQHTLGSYSCPRMQSDASHFSSLAEPLTDSNGRLRVLFAGEATHTMYHSTMHGARESGVREATRLLQNFGVDTSTHQTS